MSHSPVSGIIRKACYSEEDSVSTSPAPLSWISHSPLLVLSQLRPQRPPRAPSPMALPGEAHPPPAWSFPLTSPAGSPGAPLSRAGLSALSWEASDGVRCKNQQVPVGTPMPHSSQLLPPDLFTLGGPRPHCVSWFSSHPSAADRGVTTLLYACCTEGVLVCCSHSQEHRVLVGRLLQGYGAHLGRCPTGAQHPGTVHWGWLPEHPQCTCWSESDPEPLRAGPELTNSCSWTGPGILGFTTQPPSPKSSRLPLHPGTRALSPRTTLPSS